MTLIWLSKTLNILCYLFLAVFTEIMLNLPWFGRVNCAPAYVPLQILLLLFGISFLSLSYPCILQNIAWTSVVCSGLVVCPVSSFSLLRLAHSTFSFILKLCSSSNSWKSGTFISDFSVFGNTVTDREFVLSKWKKNEWK